MLATMLAWTATWITIVLHLRKPLRTPSKHHLNRLWSVSLLLHALSIALPWLKTHTLFFDFISAFSIVTWLTSFILYIANLRRSLETLALFILPLMLPTVMANTLLHHGGLTIELNNGLGIHIFISMLAYSILTLAALVALLLAAKNRQLRQHKPGTLTLALPPLQDMEALLFQLLGLGAFLLALGLISGFIFLDELFGRGIAHKAVLSIVAWTVFTILLYGHWRYGWRGRIAIRWTLAGFTILMLAFLGSKFVVEYLVIHS
ncbi:MAG: phosphohydrolase [Proteobacteria bacterium]|nr:MAG: phosphohydrolase [Pseudomonadota bacterium]